LVWDVSYHKANAAALSHAAGTEDPGAGPGGATSRLAGLPNFNLPQNYRSAESHIIYYVFDVMTLKVSALLPTGQDGAFVVASDAGTAKSDWSSVVKPSADLETQRNKLYNTIGCSQ